MRSVRVIPCLDVDAGRVVKGVQFVDLPDAGDPVELAARYDAEGADEVVFLDITASSDGRDTMVEVVARTAEQVFIPLDRRRRRPGGRRCPPPAPGRGRQGRVSTRPRSTTRRWCASSPTSSAPSASWWPSTPGRGEADGAAAGRCYTHGGRTPTGRDAVAWAVECAGQRGAARSCSPRWTATGPGTGSTWS